MGKEKNSRAKKILDIYYQGGLPPDLEELVQGWLADDSSEAKEEALFDIYRQFMSKKHIPDKNVYDSLNVLHEKLGLPLVLSAKTVRRPNILLRIAAVVIPVLLLAGATFYFTRNAENGSIDHVAMVEKNVVEGDKDYLELPDGSKVWINSQTEMSYPEGFEEDRTIYLDGEAFFSVEKVEGSRFKVKTEDITVTVLGTEFSVYSRPDDITEVYLYRGSVEITSPNGVFRLLPNQYLKYNPRDKSIEIKEFSPILVHDWRDEYILFTNESLIDILGTIVSHYGLKLQVDDQVSLNQSVRIIFYKEDSLEDILFVLQKASAVPFNYTIDNDYVMISGN